MPALPRPGHEAHVQVRHRRTAGGALLLLVGLEAARSALILLATGQLAVYFDVVLASATAFLMAWPQALAAFGTAVGVLAATVAFARPSARVLSARTNR